MTGKSPFRFHRSWDHNPSQMTQAHFSRLSQEEQIANLKVLGIAALKEFEVQPLSVEPLVHFENTTFRVASPQGVFNLRISRPGTQSDNAIRSEIAFLSALRDHGFRVPNPWQNRVVIAESEGVPEPRNVVLFQWMEGEFLRNRLTPKEALLIGCAMAELHEFVMTWNPPPDFERLQLHTWTLGNPRHNLIEHPLDGLSEDDRDLVNQIIFETCDLIPTLSRSKDSHNLIHADLHVGNLLLEDGALNIIDFDDSGYAFLVYDFAAALAFHLNEEAYFDVQSSLLDGYKGVRSLPPGTEDLLHPMIRQRLAGVSEWILSRTDNPKLCEIGPGMVHEFCTGLRRLAAHYA
jgi:Ser/Thr protein kinase RdoA (MazF antagonist)